MSRGRYTNTVNYTSYLKEGLTNEFEDLMSFAHQILIGMVSSEVYIHL